MASLLVISPITSIEPVLSARFSQNVSGAVHLSAWVLSGFLKKGSTL